MSAVALALVGCTGGGTQQIDNLYVEIGSGIEAATHDGDHAFGPSMVFSLGFGVDDGEGLELTYGAGGSFVSDGVAFEETFGIAPLTLHFDHTRSRDGARAWRWSTVGEIGAMFHGKKVDGEDEDTGSARPGLGLFSGPALSMHADSGLNFQLSAGPHVMWGIYDMVGGGAQVRLRLGYDEHRR